MQIEYSKFVHESKHSSVRPVFDTYIDYTDLKDVLEKKKTICEQNVDEKECEKVKRTRDTKYSNEEEEGETHRSMKRKKCLHRGVNEEEMFHMQINEIVKKKETIYKERENEVKKKKYEFVNLDVNRDKDKERFRNGLRFKEIEQQMSQFFNKKGNGDRIAYSDEYKIQLRKCKFCNVNEIELPPPKFEFNKLKVQELKGEGIIEDPSEDVVNGTNSPEENEDEQNEEEDEHSNENENNNDNDNEFPMEEEPKKFIFRFREEHQQKQQITNAIQQPRTHLPQRTHQTSILNRNRINNAPVSNLNIINEEVSVPQYKFIKFSDSYMCFDKPNLLSRDYSQDIIRMLKDVSITNKSLPLLNNKISIYSGNEIEEIFVLDPIKTNPETGALESYLTESQLQKRAKLLYPSRQDFIKEVVNKLLKFLLIIKTLSESTKISSSTERIRREKTKRINNKLNEIKKTKIVTFSEVNSFMESPFGVYDMRLFQAEFRKRLKQNEDKKKTKRLNDLKQKMKEALIQKEEKEESDNDIDEDDFDINRDHYPQTQTFRRRKDILPNDLLNDAKLLNGGTVYYPRKKMNYLDGLKMLIKEEASKSSRK